ncbi:MAG: Gfo/Idh/MocA family oxidoreductase [Kosmotogaceae bacterium]|nr:Gfo/Idh/MocA family oxidoreductase [Kosmotogaceae bacterium]
MKVNLGIVGAGIASRELHLPALRKLTELFKITAVNSRTRKKAEEFAEIVGGDVEVFDSYEEMLNSDVVDAVVLAVPIALNPEMIEAARNANKPVICEKPVAATTKEAIPLLRLHGDTPIYIAENYRHIEVYKKAETLINEGRLGKPLAFSWLKWVDFGQDNKYVQTKWRQTPQHIGGFISDGGVHDVAALRKILGNVEEVSGFSERNFDYLGAENSVVFNMTLGSNVIGNYSVVYGAPASLNRFEIVCADGIVQVDKDNATLEIYSSDREKLFVNKTDGFAEEFTDFHRVIEGQVNSLGTIEEAVMDLATIEAGLISAKEKRVVKVDSLLNES